MKRSNARGIVADWKKRLAQSLFRGIVACLQSLPALAPARARPVLVIYKPDGLGDLILASGAIRLIAEWAQQVPKLSTVLVVAHFAEEFAKREFPMCEVHSLPFCEDRFRSGFFKMLRAARRLFSSLNLDILVSLRHQLTQSQTLVLSWLAPKTSYAVTGCPILEDYLHRGHFVPTVAIPYPSINSHDTAGELEAHAALCSALTRSTCTARTVTPRLNSYPVSEGNSLVIFPFASDSIRQYPILRLASALEELPKGLFERIQLCGPVHLEARLRAFRDVIKNPSAPVEITPTENFSQAVTIIANCLAFLGMDSGPAHAAIALDKPAVFILGGGHFGYFAPWARSHKQAWLHHSLPCYECNWHCPFPEPLCITSIHPQDLSIALQRVLQTRPSRPSSS